MTKKKTAYTGGTVRGGGNGKLHSQNTTTRAAGQPIFTAAGKVAGVIDGDTFRKRVQWSKHLLLKPRKGWAMDCDVLDQVHAAGVRRIEVEDIERRVLWSTSLAHFERRCSPPFNRGYGEQVSLELTYWHQDGQPGANAEPDPDAPRQLSLFAETGTP